MFFWKTLFFVFLYSLFYTFSSLHGGGAVAVEYRDELAGVEGFSHCSASMLVGERRYFFAVLILRPR